jgi:hypothetical protein
MDNSAIEIIPSLPQYDFIASETSETFLTGGRGGGKSFAEGISLYNAWSVPGSIHLLAAPTYDVLRNSTLKQIVDECWIQKLGLEQGHHFVINEKPDPSWNIQAFSALHNTRILSGAHGSFVVLDSLENYNKHRGSQYDTIHIDEYQNVNEEARKILLGCLRGSRYKELKKLHQLKYAGTPPEDPSYLIKLMEELGPEHASFYSTSTFDNKENLPDSYIRSLLAGLDDLSIEREVYGKLVSYNSRPWLYAFNKSIHVQDVEYNPSLPLLFFMDFNIDYMACLVAQKQKDGTVNIIDEFIPRANIDIEDRAETMIERYGKDAIRRCIVTGDPAGAARHVMYFARLAKVLNLKDSNFQVASSAWKLKTSRMFCNSLIARTKFVTIHSRCKYLINDCNFVRVKENGDIDKSNPKLTHYLDSLRYGLEMHLSWWWEKNKK